MPEQSLILKFCTFNIMWLALNYIPISVTKVGIRVAQYFPKVAQKEVKSEPKGCQIPGLQLKENSLPRPFKNSYISCHIASRSSDRL